jgi:alkanesulfonate monooxygenase SsuD/methylene tetrahydromethanopterin reductase-like flavin-dependent oxidoreductase (luciferase family)
VEIGVYTFAELRGATTPEQRLRDLMEEVDVAEAVGLDVFGVGARTSRIRLTSAVTVLSSDDPVRVFQEFSEVDLLSGGRAEIMAGRGSFIESFPLFGYDLRDYDKLFVEKLERLLAVRAGAVPGVHPRPVQEPLPVWIAVGGNPESAVRAGSLGLPMALAIIGGQPERFVPFAEVHREAAQAAGHARPALSINSHGYVGNPDEFFPGYAEMMTTIGRERGWPPMQRQDFDALRTRRGALVVGSTQEVVEKILFQHELFGHDRFLMQTSVGSLPHAQVLRSIERLGTEVVPAVRAALKD